MTELEREIVGYLIKYGHLTLEYREGKATASFNVAGSIFSELEEDGVYFQDPRYRALLECYKLHYMELGEGVKVPEHYFIELDNPEASSAAVDILTEGDNHKQSTIWKEHDICTESEEERLGKIIPKAIILYKSKAIEAIIANLGERLAGLGDDDEMEAQRILEAIAALNAERNKIAHQTARNIL